MLGACWQTHHLQMQASADFEGFRGDKCVVGFMTSRILGTNKWNLNPLDQDTVEGIPESVIHEWTREAPYSMQCNL